MAASSDAPTAVAPQDGGGSSPTPAATAPSRTAAGTPPPASKAVPPIATSSTPGTAAAKPNDGIDAVNPHDFKGEVASNNDLPSQATQDKIANYVVLDRHGKSHTFRGLYSGRNCARRVLVIFVRHFFCGNCQEYLRTLSASITPDALLRLPISTFIAVVGCGDPGLIDMYAEATGCPFPIYADPTRRLYGELGMIRTLALGERPAYMRKGLLSSSLSSIAQGLRQIRSGLVIKAGDQRQIGGEFLFEPYSVLTPTDEVDRQMGRNEASLARKAAEAAAAATADDATSSPLGGGDAAGREVGLGQGGGAIGHIGADDDDDNNVIIEDKRVTWCHRMRTTRDHAEIPELREILGLDGAGLPIKDKKRWSKAVETRKGTGLSMASQMSGLHGAAAGA